MAHAGHRALPIQRPQHATLRRFLCDGNKACSSKARNGLKDLAAPVDPALRADAPVVLSSSASKARHQHIALGCESHLATVASP
eukprot:11642350-Alexandrium_andersonii.AAC.1